uniref:Trichome birefringence-like N-terminal domain-containing protein n=1 Tax=Kalanchoe fedtschenkoi TaxID=63787 RepID=A0A7N1A6Z8_KALFE
MERQRSFSIKPTRFWLFCFTIASSLTFISFCSVWVCKLSPSLRQETRAQFNATPTESPTRQVIVLQTMTVSSSNFSVSGFKGSILTGTHHATPRAATGSDRVSTGSTTTHGVATTSKNSNFSALRIQDPILSRTLVRQPQIASGSTGVSDRSQSSETGGVGVGSVVNSSSGSTSLQKSSRDASIYQKDQFSGCDITKGKWVFDESYPLYTNRSCPFIDEGFDCLGNGRPDMDYMKWRWQPQGCDIPRFDSSKMLEMLRGKRLVFVGDSINRNQFESMLCLLMGAVEDPTRVYETRKRKITKEKGNYSFRFADYACSVEYYVTHFLVHEGKARVGQKRRQVLRIDSIDRGSSRWRGADILVFNTAHWWSHDKTKAGANYFQEMGQVYPHLDVSTAFRKALTTWASWVDNNINPRKTRVFFRSSSPSHFRGGLWNSGGHCAEATRPINETLLTPSRPEKNMIVEEVLMQMKTDVTLLNITSLSEYRIDAHPSIYGKKIRSSKTQDCSHWCLPGVPDTWNQLLYFHLHHNQNLKPTM